MPTPRLAPLAALALMFMPAIAAPADTAAPTTGQKIGAVIKDVVSTALPVVGNIIDLLSKKGATVTAKSAPELNQAVATVQADVNKTTKDALNQKLVPLTKAADDLGVVAKFLDSGLALREHLVAIRVGCDAATPDWFALQNSWQAAAALLSKLATLDPDIKGLDDLYLRTTLGTITRRQLDAKIIANNALSSRRPKDLRAQADILLGYTASLGDIAGYQIDDIKKALDAVPPGGKQGGADLTQHFQNRVQKLIATP